MEHGWVELVALVGAIVAIVAKLTKDKDQKYWGLSILACFAFLFYGVAIESPSLIIVNSVTLIICGWKMYKLDANRNSINFH